MEVTRAVASHADGGLNPPWSVFLTVSCVADEKALRLKQQRGPQVAAGRVYIRSTRSNRC